MRTSTTVAVNPTSAREATGQAAHDRVRLNIGCGPVQPDGWVNIDNSYRARLASRLPAVDRLLVRTGILDATEFGNAVRAVNLHRPLPWNDGTVHAIYAGEVLEHFTREAGARLLRECHRVLAPGGVLRMRVPDNARFWRNYVNDYEAMRSRPRAEWTDAHARWTEMFFREIWTGQRFGSAGHYHKWMYDDITLIMAFEAAGFREVERMPFLDSRIRDVASVEVRDDLIVEGVKANG